MAIKTFFREAWAKVNKILANAKGQNDMQSYKISNIAFMNSHCL